MADSQEVKNKKIRQRLHTTVFNQCFSPDGKYLATCDNFGNIAIFHLPTALSADATEESWRPTFTFKAQNGAIYSLTSTDRLLIAGGTGDIQAWVWNDLTGRDTKPAWNLGIDSAERFGKPETNCLVVSKDQRLFAGCGDNNVHIWDLDTGRHVNKYGMHDDYIHTLHLRSNQDQCISGSEDGTVQIWDTRAPGQAQHILEPYKEEGEASNTAQHGRWIGSVAVDRGDDWMICGGGPASRMWHLRSLEVTAVFPTNHPTYHLMFHEDSVISAGGENNIRHWSVNGEQRSSVPCTPTTVYNVAINDKADNTKVMAIAGNSHKIDICTNFGYRAFSLSVC